jgi:hypothetical protein
MLAAMTYTDIQSKLAEYEDMVRLLTVKLQELAAENTKLRSEKSDALSVCQSIYNDPDAPLAIRTKAAAASLPFERAKLMPEKAPLDLVAEPAECLADTVHRQRTRMNRLLALPLEERSEMFAPGNSDNGNGSDDDTFG